MSILQQKTTNSTQPAAGTNKWISWLNRDISSWLRRKPKKLSTAKQKQIIELFLNLYSSGFHLSEIVDFLDRSHLVESRFVYPIREDHCRGRGFLEIMGGVGF